MKEYLLVVAAALACYYHLHAQSAFSQKQSAMDPGYHSQGLIRQIYKYRRSYLLT
ncbi:hypothetical protein THF1A12_70258 [Vibrio jasicida]|uniref:Uncharacterized protein n=1 Tax=Vibrio jasicida TaxID=766224 RepID=A0AAU9QXI2_9VIBR|nr:hypothetical protein THF1A12_70258 [Vibrio jasicida]